MTTEQLEKENRILKVALTQVKETAYARKQTIRMQYDSGLSLVAHCGIALAKCAPLQGWNETDEAKPHNAAHERPANNPKD